MLGFTPKHDHALNGRTVSRRDQEEGGVAGLLIENLTIVCWSRRDQVEGGVSGLS